jgi:hypothetical protein
MHVVPHVETKSEVSIAVPINSKVRMIIDSKSVFIIG